MSPTRLQRARSVVACQASVKPGGRPTAPDFVSLFGHSLSQLRYDSKSRHISSEPEVSVQLDFRHDSSYALPPPQSCKCFTRRRFQTAPAQPHDSLPARSTDVFPVVLPKILSMRSKRCQTTSSPSPATRLKYRIRCCGTQSSSVTSFSHCEARISMFPPNRSRYPTTNSSTS